MSLGVKSKVCKMKNGHLTKFKDGQKFYMCKEIYRLTFSSVGTRQLLSLGMNLSRCKINIEQLKKTERENTQFVQVESIAKTNIIADKVYCVTEPKNNSVVFNGIMTANCGEQPLPPYGCCDLGPIILPKFVKNPFTNTASFDFDRFKEAVSIQVRFLDNVLDP